MIELTRAVFPLKPCKAWTIHFPGIIQSVFIFICALLILTGLAFAGNTPGPISTSKSVGRPATILILHSYHKEFSWTNGVDKGIRDILMSALPNANLVTEYMDTKYHFNATHLENLLTLYQHKYHGKQIDLVISSDDNAFDFLRQKGGQIFGTAPIVFCGVNYFQDYMLEGHSNFTGVVEAFDVQSTLDAALRFHPFTQHVAVVLDQTPTGHSVVRRLNELLPSYAGKYEFLMFDNETMAGLLRRVSALPVNSLVLLFNFNRDRDGRIFSHEETIQLLRRSASVPIYGVWDFHMGHGLVGGKITSGRHQGIACARLALRILNGEPVDTIRVVKQSPNQWMFDYHELVRFDLLKSQLPDDSIIINRPVSFYEVNKSLIWGMAVGILFLIGVIAVLTVNIIDRKKAQIELRDTAQKLSTLLEALPIVPFATSFNSKNQFLYVSQAITDITGYQPENFISDNAFWQQHIHPDDSPSVFKQLSGKEPFKERLIYRFLIADGQYLWFSDTRQQAEPVGKGMRRVVGFWQDITAEQKLRQESEQHLQQAIQSDKMSSLGELVAGVAHEIRNPNAFISTNMPLLRETWQLLSPLVEKAIPHHQTNLNVDELCNDMENMIDDITAGSVRIDRVVNELNEFTRSSENGAMVPVQINEVIQKAQILVGAQIRKTFSNFSLILDPDLPLVNGHTTKLEQVVANLVVNAIHAVRSGVKSDLKIFTRQLVDPPAVLVQVQDNGHGIAPELRARIFEPFFTTHRETGGTGLGLSICYRLVKEHQGAIFLVSRPGRGSRFTVALPCRPGQPIVIQPTLLWVDCDAERLKQLELLARDIQTLELIGLSRPVELFDRLNDLPQVLTVCIATPSLGTEVAGLLEKLAEVRPLITRAVYCGPDHQSKTQTTSGPLADAVVAGPLTSELLEHIIHMNLRKIL